MSETITIDDITISDDSDGYIEITQPTFEGDEGSAFQDVVLIRKDDRAAVALVLLGGVTDELVERASASLLELVRDTKWDYLFDVESDRRESLRTLLAAIFGPAADA